MPKVPGGSPDVRQGRRHNPLAEEYAPTGPVKQKTPKRRKASQEKLDAGNGYIDAKASRRILQTGQQLIDEDEAERKASQPNLAFDFSSRQDLDTYGDEGEDRILQEDDEEAWGSDEPEDDADVDPNDQAIFDRFNPAADTSDPSRLFDPALRNAPEDQQSGGGTNLADLILAKIAAHEAAANNGEITDPNLVDRAPSPDFAEEEEIELPPKVVEVYTKIGQLLSRHRSGPLPKPFKILPTLPAAQIPHLIALTRPDEWTPHVYFLATRLFISSKPAVAQPYLTGILLPRVRDDIRETKKLHVHLYNALKKSLYKPGCFFKGFLFPLLEGFDGGECTLKEAHIVGSVIARVSVPVLHSAAALLRLCDIAAEQFSVRKEGGGGAATNTFIRILLEKKYALPYKVIDALVFHFLRFKALSTAAGGDVDMDAGANAQSRRELTALKLPVLWHQGLLAFAQRYRNEITEDQREALLDLINAVGHKQMGPETRRELLEGRGRGVVVEQTADAMMADGGDDTMIAV